MSTSEINESVNNYLSAHGITAKVIALGDSCPQWCADRDKQGAGVYPRSNHIHGQCYQLILAREKRVFIVEFWNSYRDAELNAGIGAKNRGSGPNNYHAVPFKSRPGTPKPAEILACIEWHDAGSFENFCGDLDYDTDSRKALRVYETVQEQFTRLSRFLTAAEMNELAELVREY